MLKNDKKTPNKKELQGSFMSGRMKVGLAILLVIYAGTLILIVNSAINYKNDDTIELLSSKAETVAALMASDIKITNQEYIRLLNMSFSDLLRAPVNQELEHRLRDVAADDSIRYVYLISHLPPERVRYRLTASEAEEYGLEPGAMLDYVYLLDAVISDEQRIEDTDGYGYLDIDRYTSIDAEMAAVYEEQIKTNLLVSDRWGTYISGFAPVYTDSGLFIGMLGVDINLETYHASMLKFHTVIGLFISINLLIVAIAIWLIRYALRSRHIANQQDNLLNQDSLTLTLSRRGLMRALNEVCKQPLDGRSHHESCLFIVDVDHFKEYNDFYGHLKGDEALRKIGQVLREQAEKYNGVVGRYGGDEFMLIFEQIDMARPERIADVIIDAVQALEIEHAKSPVSLYKSVSIGIAVFSADEDLTAEKIIEKADKALYRAKRNGRNQASA